jgi:hypothetical protein
MSMTGKDTWACTICGDGFTRRSTANRHNRNLHVGNGMIVRPYEYIIGRQNGSFPEPTDPLLFRKTNKKTQNSNTNNAAYPVCSHGIYNNNRNSEKDYNNYNTYGMHPSFPLPNRPPLPVLQQESFHKPVHDDKQRVYPKPLERTSKMVKLAEFERLSYKFYPGQKAEVVTRMVYSYVFDLGDESFLDDQLKILRDIERTRSR